MFVSLINLQQAPPLVSLSFLFRVEGRSDGFFVMAIWFRPSIIITFPQHHVGTPWVDAILGDD